MFVYAVRTAYLDMIIKMIIRGGDKGGVLGDEIINKTKIKINRCCV